MEYTPEALIGRDITIEREGFRVTGTVRSAHAQDHGHVSLMLEMPGRYSSSTTAFDLTPEATVTLRPYRAPGQLWRPWAEADI